MKLRGSAKVQFHVDVFNVLNTPNFSPPEGLMGALSGTAFTPRSTFGRSTSLWYARLGGLNRLYQVGGPRSIQLSTGLSF